MSHEPFDSFLTDLRKLSTSCDFDKLNDGMLVYKLADGLENERVREKIISKGASITLEKSIELCRADELTRCRKKEQASEEYTNIEELRKDGDRRETRRSQNFGWERGSTSKRKCNFCSFIHVPRNCPAYGKRCHRCNRLNHFKQCCKVKGIQEVSRDEFNTGIGKENSSDIDEIQQVRINSVRASQSNVSSRNPADVYFIEPIGTCDAVDGSNRLSKREAFTILILNGTNVRVKLDTGA